MSASVLDTSPAQTATETMRAVVVRGFDLAPQVEEVVKPLPGRDEVIVKIEASGLCHTDIHAAHGD